MKLQFLKKENHGQYYSLLYQIEPMTLTTSYQEPETHNALMQPVPGKRVVEHHSCNTVRADFTAVGGHLTNFFLITDTGLTLTPNDLDISEKQKQKIWGDLFEGIEALDAVFRSEYAVEVRDDKDKFVSQIDVFNTFEKAEVAARDLINTTSENEHLSIVRIDYDMRDEEIGMEIVSDVMRTAKEVNMDFLTKYDIEADESYYSPEFETMTYYFTADKSLINELFPDKYPEAVSTEISVEIPVSSYEARNASVMVSPTEEYNDSLLDSDWSDYNLPYEEIEKLLDLAKEPVVLMEMDYKGYYKRFALTISEFNEDFRDLLEKGMPGPSNQGDSYTLRPLVHVWYELAEIEGPRWTQFFTDMESGLPESDIEAGNLAYIDFDEMKSLKDAVYEAISAEAEEAFELE